MTSNPPPIRLSQLSRAALAFLIGILIFTALVLSFMELAGLEDSPRPGREKPAEVLLCIAAAMLLAGYGTGRISGKWEPWLGAGLGVLLSLGAGPAYMDSQGIVRPLAHLVSLLILVPCGALGGRVAAGFARYEVNRRGPLQLPLVVRQRRAFIWLAFFLAVGMTAASVWILRLDEKPQLAWSGALFFGASALVLGWRGLHYPPQAILRDEGIEFPAFQAVIPWSDVVDASPSPLYPVEYVRFRVRNAEHYVSRLSPLQRALTQTGESEPNIGIALTGTPYTAEEICALVRSQVREGRAGFADFW